MFFDDSQAHKFHDQEKESSTRNLQATIEESWSFDGPPDSMISVAGKSFLYFAGNGYLGLQADPQVLAATCEAVLRYGVGTATTRLAFTSPPVFEVERRVADILGTDKALYTASGYVANQIMLETLDGTFDRIFIDEASHDSLFSATRRIRALRCRPIEFKHRNIGDLKDKLDSHLRMNERPIILTDGVFSLLGTIAPIRQYMELLECYENASLWVDDAHGFGILGKKGRGTLEHFGFDTARVNRTVQDDEEELDFALPDETNGHFSTPLYLGFSLSKAVGGCGGVIPGSESFIQRLKDRSNVYFGASAPASPIAAATAKSLTILADNDLRDHLDRNTRLLKSKLRELGLEVEDNPVPIAVLTIGSSGNMRRIQKELSERGILISYLPRHAGLGSQGALRIAVFATHTEEMVDELIDAMAQVL